MYYGEYCLNVIDEVTERARYAKTHNPDVFEFQIGVLNFMRVILANTPVEKLCLKKEEVYF